MDEPSLGVGGCGRSDDGVSESVRRLDDLLDTEPLVDLFVRAFSTAGW